MLDLTDRLLILVLAAGLEAVVGYPDALFRAIGHPVSWIGRLIAALDAALNRPALPETFRRAGGIATVVVLLGIGLLGGLVLEGFAAGVPLLGIVLLVVTAATLIAGGSLDRHVRAVAVVLQREGLPGGRREIAKIVGRDPETLDGPALCRAAIESLAENSSDGVTAPAVWYLVLGLPGMLAYKAINTADSMIGHLTARYRAFGWAAARLDDLVNLPASRLTGLMLIAAAAVVPGASASGALRAVLRDAKRHRSPNAGWPEAAMAGALGLRLAGPRVYGGVRVDDAWMGDGRAEATPADIFRALTLYRAAFLGALGILAVLGLLVSG
ncbi:Adenosylcobinamide-phosphate synthase [Rhodovulum sp. PH10]|uniref:adenosylcobinamide-phosphate synthase CbiB n=1 Tax=Rhodovulum sp. PH10 TaxID=1187851 RepID=UPI00027C29DE|nr:adenosylcobinamide-phosphate synthase CbiB [Rhodovulum sp. PH10]EJW12840.1 Adenosylcobinamide-phosphate synthase [Rhodovulum sp. PH10]